MSAASITRRGRASAESLMDLTLAAFSPHEASVDGMTVTMYAPEGTTVGKVQAGSRAGSDTATRTVRVGGTDRPVVEAGLHIPISAPVPAPGDRGIGWEYEVTAVGPSSDPALLGRRFLVVGVPAKSYTTARRLDVCEVPAP